MLGSTILSWTPERLGCFNLVDFVAHALVRAASRLVSTLGMFATPAKPRIHLPPRDSLLALPRTKLRQMSA